jgi:pimeloyl-ACP methyl ester carboxylesterase
MSVLSTFLLNRKSVLVLLAGVFSLSAMAADLYVSPPGSDANAESPSAPMDQFFRAFAAVKSPEVTLEVIRDQQPLKLVVNQDSEAMSSAIAFPGERTQFKGFDRYDIKTNKGSFSVICPKQAAPGKPWLWRSLFWGNDSPTIDRFTAADLQLLEQGFHVVKAPGDVSGHPRGNVAIDAAYTMLTQQYGFSKKLSMASMSRETLALFRWASANPEKVESIYVDNGVCNVKSWPGGKRVPGNDSIGDGNPRSWALLKKTYGFKSDAEALAAKVSPIDLLAPLAKADVPILMVCGTKDSIVPYAENGAIMKERYQALGGSIQMILEDKGHHPHGLADPTPVVAFIQRNSK